MEQRQRGRGRTRPNMQANVQPRNLGPVRPQVPRPPVPQQIPHRGQHNVQVQDAVERIQNLRAGNECVPIGRGGVRGRHEIEFFRAPRPESSKASKEGITGNKIELIANYFPITSYTNWSLYQYRVDFNPEQERTVIQKGLLHNHASKLGPYIFDGTMLFSSKKYEDKFELVSKRSYDDQVVIITISFVNVIKTGDYANIQVFNILMKNCIRHLELQQIGRDFYDMAARINVERHRLQVLPGYETTIGMFDSGLMLRAEITTKIMRQDTALDFLYDCLQNGRGIDQFKEGIIGSTVLTVYNNQTYKINDVDDKAKVSSTFLKKDGSRMSYLQYYREKWNVNVKDSRQPMLISKKKKIMGTGDRDVEEQLIYLVPELCTMTGFTEKMRGNFDLMRDLAVHTQVNPIERVNRYNNFMTRLQTTPRCMDVFNTWNMTLSRNLVQVTGRVLQPETIQCSDAKNKFDGGIQADWTSHLRNTPMFTCATIKQWHVFYPPRLSVDLVKRFLNSLRSVALEMNLILSMPNMVPSQPERIGNYIDEVVKVCNIYNPPLIMCLIPKRPDIYIAIKKTLCVAKSIPSQIVTLRHVQKINLSINTKIAIQINAKLGGAPWRVVIPSKGMMIVGFDVCHDKRKNRSYGALIATMNDTHTSYYSNVQVHRSGEEISNHFGAIIVAAVQKYIDKNKAFPISIVIYRDGVGDGQLSYVQKTEVNSIKTMCQQTFKKVPALAFIIVKKRISTRFFARHNKGLHNPPPGTIIDTKVTDPSMYDFYLVSQNTRFGTVTPTHYNIIEDTLENWSPDKMQRLTFKLCHMYYNWSGTVRVPAPCQLAHKLAFLAGQIGVPNVGLNELLYFL